MGNYHRSALRRIVARGPGARSPGRTLATAAVLFLAGAALTACSATCDLDGPAERYARGRTTTVAGGAFYESSSWHGALLTYPGGKRYDFVHNLGIEPVGVFVYLSFSPSGVGEVEGKSDDTAALCTGDSCKIELINADVVRVQNTTCADFWVRVVAWSAPSTPAVPIADSGTQDGP